MWLNLLQLFWGIVTFKKMPADIPFSKALMVTLGFLFFIIIQIQWYSVSLGKQFDGLVSFVAGISLLFIYMVYTYGILRLNNKQNRFVQTMTGIWASHALIHFFVFPLFILSPYIEQSKMESPLWFFIGILYLAATMGLTLWKFLNTAFIYRNALDTTFLNSLLASFCLMLCSFGVILIW